MKLESARSKAEAVARMYYLGNRVVEALGPGSKEKKSALTALGTFVGLDLQDVAGKHECARRIAEVVGATWDADCVSAGDTVTLIGLNRLIDGAVLWHIGSGAMPVRSLVRDLANLSPAPRWDDEEDGDVDDLSELDQNISDRIAELSSEGPVPQGLDVSRAFLLDGEPISLSDGSWRTPLAAVQGWLNL
ncbi:MAG TPA: hypothetical protein DHV14_10540, partial [Micrococcales bacterium]|nr:hypothetical protein [Micrococcales bacterium]